MACSRSRGADAATEPSPASGIIVQRFKSVSPLNAYPAPIQAEVYFRYGEDLGIHRLDPTTKESKLIAHPADLWPQTATLSPDGRLLLFGRGASGHAHLLDLATNRPEISCPVGQHTVTDATWARDGQHVVIRSAAVAGRLMTLASDVSLFRVDRQDRGVTLEKVRTLEGVFHLPSFSPNGDRLAIADSKGHVYLESTAGTAHQPDLAVQPMDPIPDVKRFFKPQWSPDGKRLLLLGEKEMPALELFLASLDPNDPNYLKPETIGAFPHHGFYFRHPDYPPVNIAAWSPDGKFIAYVADSEPHVHQFSDSWDLFLHDVVQGKSEKLTQQKRIPPAMPFNASVVRWAPDGRAIAFMQYPGLQTSAPSSGLDIRIVDLNKTPVEPTVISSSFGDMLLDWK